MKRILPLIALLLVFLSGSFSPPTSTQFISGKVTCKQPEIFGSLSGYSILLFADGKKAAETKIDSSSSYELLFTLLDQKRFNYFITDGLDTLLLRSDTALTREGGETTEEEIVRNFSLPKAYPMSDRKAICPICGKSDMAAEIVYGDGVSYRDERKHKIIPGGCIVSLLSPYWYCERDKIHF